VAGNNIKTGSKGSVPDKIAAAACCHSKIVVRRCKLNVSIFGVVTCPIIQMLQIAGSNFFKMP
jgi:hypothetical protein